MAHIMELRQETINSFDLPLSDYYICYFDVLGYKAFFENNDKEHKRFLIELLLSDSKIGSIIKNTEAPVDIKYRVYSDNYILYFKADTLDKYRALKTICAIVQKIQILLLSEFKILVRGGITIGEFYADERIVFGEGLIKAVTLEAKYAQNPRIIVDADVFKEELLTLHSEGYLAQDIDDLYYVNFFKSTGTLILIKGACERLITKHCKYHHAVKDEKKIIQTERTISKYIWLIMKFNEYCDLLNSPSLKINHILKINEKLLKTEIYIDTTK